MAQVISMVAVADFGKIHAKTGSKMVAMASILKMGQGRKLVAKTAERSNLKSKLRVQNNKWISPRKGRF
jgi:hypothetical protein